ncbi:PAS domain-containing hybrid sensor histidine kinase/response regulator [Stigmatella erecta]|uniref:histidine kinase n=1 Tax=Stigmatella erecta TaxID=83460 RepID=A0A1I0H265_9BACT|nr:PAS domain-containing hybrid sensor histidine kinase/response regulator [Stigmatella erecta]SET77642.1 PAS domain S-box-containing protein [Stigmatella erecta]
MESPEKRLSSTGVEESAEELYDSAPCGYISTLPDGTLVRANQTFLRWMGYSPEELLGHKRLQDLLTGGGRIFHETHYAPLLQLQGAVNELTFDLVRKNGQRFPVLLNTVQKKDASGKTLFHRTTLFDITDRKNYERELVLARKKAEQATQAKADFLSMMSHEIRTPMNAIIGLSNLLGQAPLPPLYQEYVRILRSSSENLLGLLNSILDFNKLEAGKMALEERRFDLRQLLHGICSGLSVKAEEKKLAIRVEFEPRVPSELMGDPVKLGQVLTNLLGNAIKFTEQGAVTLGVRLLETDADGVSLGFRVSDTGIGIDQDRLAQIFDEFTQASYDITWKYGGSGLGLTICQKLLELHGSKMHVASVPGEGSTFSFDVRLKVAPDAVALDVPEDEALLDARALQGLKVLVAEDNAVNVFVLSQFLRRWGVDFDVVGNGRLAVERAQAHRYDAVLMDLQMPQMDGYEATQLLRNHAIARLRRLPIIALSASVLLGPEAREDVGFTDFVGKPFLPQELFLALARHGVRAQAPAEKACPQEPAGQALPGVQAPAPELRFDLQRFKGLAEGDRSGEVELSTIAIGTFEKQKHDLRRALETGNVEAFDFLTHQLKMPLELMQPRVLCGALEQGRKLLQNPGGSADSLHAVIRTIHEELDAILDALKEDVGYVPPGTPRV